MSGLPPLRSFPSTLFDKTADWFERAQAALLGNLPCRQGCHHCCIGIFPVTSLDEQELQRGLHTLPESQRQAITLTAREQVRMMRSAVPRLADTRFLDQWPDQEIDQVVEQYRDLPCPALQHDGSCGLYDFRPLTCRSMGIPFDIDGKVHGACSMQTSVPLIRLSPSLRQQEEVLAKAEADALDGMRRRTQAREEEMLLPFAFLEIDRDEATT